MASGDSNQTPNVFRSNPRLTRSPQPFCQPVSSPRLNTLSFSPTPNSPFPTVQVFPPRDHKSNCPKCSKFVADGFNCDSCLYWFHPDCIKIPKILIKRIGNIAALKIECQSCRDSVPTTDNLATQTLPFSCLDVASQTDSVGQLHRFCQTTDAAVPTVTNIVSNTTSTQTATLNDPVAPTLPITITITTATQTIPTVILPPTSVPLLDLTDDDEIGPLPTPALSAAPDKFVIVQGENDPMSNFYEFTMMYNNVEYGSLEQCYQHVRAVRAKMPELATSILDSSSPRQAKSLSKRIPRPTNRDRDTTLMRELLRIKAEQCSSFRSALSSSGEARLIHSTHPSDTYWGSGLFPHQSIDSSKPLPGQNLFGALLEEIRPLVPTIPYSTTTNIDYEDRGSHVVVLQDGEKIGLSVSGRRTLASVRTPSQTWSQQRTSGSDYRSSHMPQFLSSASTVESKVTLPGDAA